eukprot:CAMPEP_0114612340 /NCGR_PEP_ID=MMETSP0168-20121206/4572_1 /TAXON_ID=95228 ORGANISM="Vannella sp., Strain DIVA3 517/6/12" /NCGR_SAMPLE_ID=MMETSP0168 /ASSEMBLY_ACC=CAM_ASM_000044 /LENGTH=150 /DNA_ID=CAMNT_0001823323 /DNA_START=39 /DNA_END=491 /DNA_ORIENTATION=-
MAEAEVAAVTEQVAELNFANDFDADRSAAIFKALEDTNFFSSIAVVDLEGKTLNASYAVVEAEAKKWVSAFDDYDTTLGNGAVVNGKHHDIHRFYPEKGIVYGRSIGAETGQGVALVKAGKAVVVVTYLFPRLSSRMVPLVLKEVGAALA